MFYFLATVYVWIGNMIKISSLHNIAFLSFLIAATVSTITTTESSRLFIEPARVIAGTIAVLTLITTHIWIGLKFKFSVITFSFFSYFFIVGFVNSVFYGGIEYLNPNIILNIIMICCGFAIFQNHFRHPITDYILFAVLAYFIFALLLTVLFNGLEMSYPPHFVFSFADRTYSQGITGFFGIAAITCVYLVFSIQQKFVTPALAVLSIAFIALAFLGGARGDFLATFLVILLIIFKYNKGLFLLLLGGIILLLFTKSINDYQGQFILLDRISIFADKGLGARQDLYLKSLSLLIEEPQCLFFGCGFNFFQKYYNLDPGLYPHNYFLELVIVFGIPFSFIFIVAIIRGYIVTMRKGGILNGWLGFFYIFHAIITSKSGSLDTSWIFTSMSFLFIRNSLSLPITAHHVENMQYSLKTKRDNLEITKTASSDTINQSKS